MGPAGIATPQKVDWSTWEPTVEATLLYVVRGDKILLIHKKRGLGAGKLNGVGGKIEAGESPLAAAVREFEEELLASPVDPEKLGEIAFDVVEEMAIRIHVFRSNDLVGEPKETVEARPEWTPVCNMPYDRMWEDDQYWLPLLLENRRFEVYASFDGDVLVSCEVFETPQ